MRSEGWRSSEHGKRETWGSIIRDTRRDWWSFKTGRGRLRWSSLISSASPGAVEGVGGHLKLGGGDWDGQFHCQFHYWAHLEGFAVILSWQGEGTVVEQLYESSEGEIVAEQFRHQFRHQGH